MESWSLGRVSKGVKCNVVGCDKEAIRSLSNQKVSSAGLKVGTARRAYLCKEHYKEYKRKTRTERQLKQWRYSG
jgi:hypothetical protein